MRSTSVVATILLSVTAVCIATHAQTAAAAYTVTLHCGLPIPLNPAKVPAIYSWALRLVSSSQRNSANPDWEFPLSEVEQEYRKALAGDYLRIDYESLATIKTTSGIVYASTIVKSLDPLARTGEPSTRITSQTQSLPLMRTATSSGMVYTAASIWSR